MGTNSRQLIVFLPDLSVVSTRRRSHSHFARVNCLVQSDLSLFGLDQLVWGRIFRYVSILCLHLRIGFQAEAWPKIPQKIIKLPNMAIFLV